MINLFSVLVGFESKVESELLAHLFLFFLFTWKIHPGCDLACDDFLYFGFIDVMIAHCFLCN